MRELLTEVIGGAEESAPYPVGIIFLFFDALMKMKILGIIGNVQKKETPKVVNQILAWAFQKKFQPLVDKDCARLAGSPEVGEDPAIIMNKADLVIILGGDGTLLSVVKFLNRPEVPILAINLGRLGFLTSVTRQELITILEGFYSGEYQSEERMLLEARVERKGEIISQFRALNEVVIGRGVFARLLHFETFINQQYLTTYAADGVIISTPTGSTAYSLSAGGPVIYPTLEAILLIPICPHTLTNRPLIIPPTETVSVRAEEKDAELVITADGQVNLTPQPGDILHLRKSDLRIKLIVFPNRTFYHLLRDKLKWGGQ